MVVRQYKADGPLTKLLLMVVAIDDAVGLVLFSVSFGIAGALEMGSISVVSVILEPIIEIVISLVLEMCIRDSPCSAQNGTGGMLFIILFYSAISALSRSKIASSAFQKYAFSPRSTVMPVRSK